MVPGGGNRGGNRGDRRRRRSGRLVRIWATSTAALFALSALWALATPVGAAPDEPTQLIKAAAVVRGELLGPHTAGYPAAFTTVTVPESFAGDLNVATCFAFRDTVPAGCARGLSGSRRPALASTYVGRYPPLYYLLVGTPSLAWSTSTAVYLMRLLSALWSAVLIGLALAAAAVWARSRLLVVSVAVAATPLVVFLGGVVNPSGLEIAAAIATWTCGLVLVLDHRHAPPPALVAACAGSASVLALCRGLSPLWVAVVAAALVAVAPGTVPALWRSRAARRAAVVVALVGAGAGAYILGAHVLSVLPDGQPVPAHASALQVVTDVLGQTGRYLRQMVGVFGWLDTPSPLAVLVGWWAAAGALVLVAAATADRRAAAALAGVVVLAVALPTAIIASHAHSSGLVWQARDGMPLYVGVPLVAGAIAGRAAAGHRHRSVLGDVLVSRLVPLLAAGIAAAQLVDFGWALRRYTVGLGATLDPFARVPGGWRPPVPAVGLVAAAAVVAAAYGWWVARLQRASAAARPALAARHAAAARHGGPLLGELLHAVMAGPAAVRATAAFDRRRPGAPAARRRAAHGPAPSRRPAGGHGPPPGRVVPAPADATAVDGAGAADDDGYGFGTAPGVPRT